ncbi:hypothetical protein MferCBS31731_003007 [Microsporum ferrugineum]
MYGLVRTRSICPRILGCRWSSTFVQPNKATTIKDTVSIEPADLFNYTSGRWLINEEFQRARRYVAFNINRLCGRAASLFSNDTSVINVRKLEGNFNKALILTMDNGKEVIAKIPCPNAGPSCYTTASEVATLKFLKPRLTVRVPDIMAWNSDSRNDVGAEYIIMEKISGVPLAEKWETLGTLEKYKVVDQIIEMEKELINIKLPAYGCLSLRDSIPSRGFNLPPELDPDGIFCIGPSSTRIWRHDDCAPPGPWTSLTEFATSIPKQGLAHIASSESQVERHLKMFNENQSSHEYSGLLKAVMKILHILSSDARVKEYSDPTPWHYDLHLGNIFVSEDNHTQIEGIIDWQSSQIAPLFIQACFPDFLQPPKDYKPGTAAPQLPENFDELHPEQQQQARTNQNLASLSKYYEMSSLVKNKRVYDAMSLHRMLWEPFICCQDSLETAPTPFSKEDLEKHEEELAMYKDRLYLWDLVKSQLSTNDVGWVASDRWEETQTVNRYLYDMFIDTMSQEMSQEEALEKGKTWPFPP